MRIATPTARRSLTHALQPAGTRAACGRNLPTATVRETDGTRADLCLYVTCGACRDRLNLDTTGKGQR